MKYYLSVPCVGCPCVSKDLKGQACLTMHSASLACYNLGVSIIISDLSIIMHSSANDSLILISEEKGGPTPGH